MRDNNVHTLDQLDNVDKNIYRKVIEGNGKAAAVFASAVREQNEGAMVINPAPLELSDWGQAEFYAFWDEVIRTRVKQIRFNDEWEFSNGCTYELAVALDEGIPIFDSKGNPLERKSAITAIDNALNLLHHQGFDEALKKLRKHRDLCTQILQAKEEKVSVTLTPDLKRRKNSQPSRSNR
jgi:hypothetical protein